MEVEFRNEGADALRAMCRITGKNPQQLMDDVVAKYRWILEKQYRESTIVSRQPGKPEDDVELVDLIKNREAAERYFGWR